MTDLTEKWKNGELHDGFYYFRLPDGNVEIANEYKLIRYNLTKDADKVEILAPVPSYDEWQTVFNYATKYEVEYVKCVNDYEELRKENKQLEKKLEIAVKALEEMSNETLLTSGGGCYANTAYDRAQEALAKIKEIQ